jgi:hypothetical protein
MTQATTTLTRAEARSYLDAIHPAALLSFLEKIELVKKAFDFS